MTHPTNAAIRRRAYITSLAPEIQRAESETYPSTARFINTKWIFRHIRANPEHFPVLGAKTDAQLKIEITEYFDKVAKYGVFSKGHNGSKGRTFIRDDPEGCAVRNL